MQKKSLVIQTRILSLRRTSGAQEVPETVYQNWQLAKTSLNPLRTLDSPEALKTVRNECVQVAIDGPAMYLPTMQVPRKAVSG